MLKYIGDFDKLKEYGFKKEKMRVGILGQRIISVYDNEHFKIDARNRKIDYSQYDNDIYLESLECLYELIKDGLVIKVDE